MSEPRPPQDLDPSHWENMYARQRARFGRTEQLIKAMGIQPRDLVLDIGCGPGYNTLWIAQHLGPEGIVYAVDPQEGALDFLRMRLQEHSHRSTVIPLCADARELAGLVNTGRIRRPADKALLTQVLHHDEDPEGLVRSLRKGVLATDGRLGVLEYHPASAGKVGPPLTRRLPPQAVKGWFLAAGFHIVEELPFAEEQYGFIAQPASN